jgi:hypothetical protein
MTPQEKAKQLYGKFYGIPLYIKTVKECCHIAVDEVISNIEPSVSMDVISARIKYWRQVKEEIDKL